MQPRAQRGFAREVPVGGELDQRAGGDFADDLSFQTELVHERSQCSDQHFLVAGFRVGRVAARERNAGATDDGNFA